MSNPTETALARQQDKPTVWSAIEKLKPQMAQALPAHMPVDRMMRIALTMVRKDQIDGGHLADCTPESFSGALITASVLGLEPGINGEAYLVAYEDKSQSRQRGSKVYECQLIVGYQGMAKLFYQHPLAEHLDAQAVHEHDDFDYGYGTSPYLKHKPAWRRERGKIVAYYATASLTTGASAFVVLSPDEVKALRNNKEGPQGKIADPMHWMERKTAIRQLLKLLPKSATLARAIEADEKGGHELQTQLVIERDLPALDQRPDVPPDEPEQPAQPPTEQAAPVAPEQVPDPADAAQPPDDWTPEGENVIASAAALTAEAPTTSMITTAQRPKLMAVLTKHGVVAADVRHRILSELTGRPIESTTELTKDEAGAAIDTIEALTAEQFTEVFIAPYVDPTIS